MKQLIIDRFEGLGIPVNATEVFKDVVKCHDKNPPLSVCGYDRGF